MLDGVLFFIDFVSILGGIVVMLGVLALLVLGTVNN